MRIGNRLSMIARAALFAVVAVGVMATGLIATTYTLAKANELVFAPAPTELPVKSRSDRMCRG